MPEFGKLMGSMLIEIRVKPRWKHKQGATVGQRDTDPREDDGDSGGNAIVCVRCGHEITKKSQETQVGDLHEHSQVNPGGFVWNFRCFRSATGCIAFGRPSSEFAWFPGYTWQIQHCAGCDIHLGWLFASPGHQFYGLITERIVEVERGEYS